MEHPLHKIVGGCIENELPNCKMIKSKACGGQQDIPLFCSDRISGETEYCEVDILILKDDKIRVIIEIEETVRTPNKICGKFLTSALSLYYIHKFENDKPIGKSDSILFIQILDTSKLKEKSSKTGQWKNLEKTINNILPIGKIRNYKLFYGNVSDFKNREGNKCAELITYMKDALK